MNLFAHNAVLIHHYLPVFVFIAVAVGLSTVMITLGYVRGPSKPDAEKLSPYECGFAPLTKTRIKFDVRYYLVALLFIIFDLEIAFLFPWAVSLGEIGSFGFWAMMIFLGILTLGFIYEWRKGALDWQ